MIAKRIAIKPGNDSYARLAEYIQAADLDGEKSLMAWCAGCFGGEDYAEGIEEAVDVQAMNTRSRKEKTDHLVVSFRPEDEARLTPEVFKVMAERFAAALGYTDHQRHCGVHKNTGNIHMHMAYNAIHPEKYTRHEPFRDFYKLSAVCRELEQEYDLTVDNGITPGLEPTRPNQKSALVEAHTGQQSFDSYAGEHREAILRSLENAVSWRDVHAALAVYRMEIKPHGNGMVIKDRHGGRSHAMKASSLDRSLSRGKLEARFGGYEPPHGLEVQERSRYDSAPLHRSPEREVLYADYTAVATVKADLVTQQRAVLEREDLSGRGKTRLLAVLRMEELAAEEKARALAPGESPLFTGVTHRIDNNGTVIFNLPSSGTVRDTGRGVLFSAHDKAAGDVARQYAAKKWDKAVRLEGNVLRREVAPERFVDRSSEPEKRRGMER